MCIGHHLKSDQKERKTLKSYFATMFKIILSNEKLLHPVFHQYRLSQSRLKLIFVCVCVYVPNVALKGSDDHSPAAGQLTAFLCPGLMLMRY